MTKRYSYRWVLQAVIFILFLFAYIPALREWMFDIQTSDFQAYQRNIIHVLLLSFWGLTIWYRIIQKQTRIYLILISGLMIFWFIIKNLKYYHVEDINVLRYLWYLYYLPMIMIPVLGVLVGLSLGKAEAYRISKKQIYLLIIPSLCLFLMVLTNDLHNLVFSFNGEPWTDANANYELVYWFFIAWSLLQAGGFFTVLILKSRVPRSRKILFQPFIPLVLLVTYVILYITNSPTLRLFARDLTVAICLLFIGILEACINARLIPSNKRYDDLFSSSSIGAKIVSKEGRELLKSSELKRNRFLENKKEARLENGIRLSSLAINKKHYVIWQEDISLLFDIIKQLEDLNELLKDENKVLQEEHSTGIRKQSLIEKNRLYDKVQAQIQVQLSKLEQIGTELEEEKSREKICKLTSYIAIITAYIKRRNNLILIAEESGLINSKEIEYCLKESLVNIELTGAKCMMRVDLPENISFDALVFIYDTFQYFIEKVIESLDSLYVSVFYEDKKASMAMLLRSQEDLSTISKKSCYIKREDHNEWIITCAYDEGGIIYEKATNTKTCKKSF